MTAYGATRLLVMRLVKVGNPHLMQSFTLVTLSPPRSRSISVTKAVTERIEHLITEVREVSGRDAYQQKAWLIAAQHAVQSACRLLTTFTTKTLTLSSAAPSPPLLYRVVTTTYIQAKVWTAAFAAAHWRRAYPGDLSER